MSGFVIAARTRPEIDLLGYFGSYNFPVVPESLYATDGCLRLSTDKASITQELPQLLEEECYQNTESVNESTESNIRKVIIFDRMAVANRVDIKKEKIKTYNEFATSFINIIKREPLSYYEVRIIFDKYTMSSLKSSMLTNRTNGIAVRYKVADKRNIEHLSTKQFLGNI